MALQSNDFSDVLVKSEIFNKEIFGNQTSNRTDKKKPPKKKGICEFEIHPHDIENIPGTVGFWRWEIDKRKKQIETWKNRSFTQRAKWLLDPLSSSYGATTGIELLKLNPTPEAKELVKELGKNPEDAKNRLNLVEITGQIWRKDRPPYPIETYRLLFIHAVVGCSFGEITSHSLKVLLNVQSLYLQKFQKECDRELKDLQATAEKISNRGKFEEFEESIAEIYNMLVRNIQVTKKYLDYSKQGLLKLKPTMVFSNDTIVKFLMSSGTMAGHEVKKNKKELLRRGNDLLRALRYCPLLQKEIRAIGESLMKVDNLDPLPALQLGRLYKGEMELKASRLEAGDTSSSLPTSIEKDFQEALLFYNLAVKKVGKNPSNQNDLTIFIEYAYLIHYYYTLCKNSLNALPSKSKLISLFFRAEELLEMIKAQTSHANGILQLIHKDMAIEGLR